MLMNYIEELQRAFNLHLAVLLNGLQEQNVRHTPFFGYSPGTVFVTDAPNLECKKIIHAVTMRTPGSKAKIKKIKVLIPKIVAVAENLNINSVAIPLLGCGTGGLDRKTVQNLLAHNLISDKVTFYIVTSL